MAQDTTLNGPGGLRAQMVHSFYGRKDGLDVNEFNVGPKDIRVHVEGFQSQTTLVSTVGSSVGGAVLLAPYGISLLGATAASATTVYYLGAPVPGVYKTLFNASTAASVVTATSITSTGGMSTLGPFFFSTASVTSTHQTITFTGKGNSIQLFGMTTNYWGVLQTQTQSSVTTGTVFFS